MISSETSDTRITRMQIKELLFQGCGIQKLTEAIAERVRIHVACEIQQCKKLDCGFVYRFVMDPGLLLALLTPLQYRGNNIYLSNHTRKEAPKSFPRLYMAKWSQKQ